MIASWVFYDLASYTYVYIDSYETKCTDYHNFNMSNLV